MPKRIHFLLLLMIAVFFHFTVRSQGSWEMVETPAEGFLKAVHFTDSLHGWIAGANGMIIHTEDGGESWHIQISGTENDISDIFFLNQDTGWATSFNFSSPPLGTLLLKTVNGGEDWTAIPYPEENIFMNCILFLDPLKGWMGGTPHSLVSTSDGGLTWQQAAIDSSTLAFFPVISIEFYDENYGYACGGLHDIAGVVWSTSDGGESWAAFDVLQAPADEVHELHAFDSLRVMGIGGDPDFAFGAATIRTDDGGDTWLYEQIGAQGNGFDLDFRTDYEAWAPMGGTGKFVYSLDTGYSWTEIPTPGNVPIFDVHFPDSLHGWAVGQEGAVLRYIPPYTVGLEEITLLNQENIDLYNFPDPFSERTNIQFYLHEPGTVEVIIYDLTGRVVSSIQRAKMDRGDQSIGLNASAWNDGIYFYRVHIRYESHQTVSAGKMVVSH